jgi:signal transduction histidine kinase
MTSFGGKMSIESQPGNGARIILEVPATGQQKPVEAVATELAPV